MSARIKKQKGFTLIEGLVSGVVITSIIGFLFPLIHMQTKEVGKIAANQMLQLQWETIHEQFANDVRKANLVTAWNEAWVPSPSFSGSRWTQAIQLYTAEGKVFAVYHAALGELFEARFNPPVSAVNWNLTKKFSVGPHNVKATVGSGFELARDRKRLSLYLDLFHIHKSDTSYLEMYGNTYLCRN